MCFFFFLVKLCDQFSAFYCYNIGFWLSTEFACSRERGNLKTELETIMTAQKKIYENESGSSTVEEVRFPFCVMFDKSAPLLPPVLPHILSDGPRWICDL